MKNKKNVSYLVLFIFLSGLAYSCQDRPREVLNRKQMEQLMYDVYIAEATMENDYQNFNTPEKKEAYINRVFKMHKTTQAQWDTSLSWYSDRIDLYLKMNDSVKARLQRTRQGIDALVAQDQANQADPALLPPSYIPPFYTFSMADTKKGFRFRLDSAEISSKVTGKDILFTFSVIGIPPRFSPVFTSLLTWVYSDTTLYRLENIRENRTYEFSAPKFIPGDTITEVRGFVHLQDPTDMTPPILLYNIFLGDTPSTFSETDTLKAGLGTPDGKPLTPDSVIPVEPDSMEPLQPDPAELLDPDSIKEIQ